ncbi:flagellar basal body-associated FliL family protein [Albidovulum sediminicola]|uniref:Flagellar basal body-associated FliL family protein n=1 Tax=Albidovulum sediminicola TaxID=2984331 RepID=A0ABT2Z4X8_9RHOB|nr:flagellar basal body-associated FliL family protein [Defluviimonas sp. WL0075]MCV2866080.1 flagellar basal body-associated FliL family protein [Defluviimonas sp. WL0075]
MGKLLPLLLVLLGLGGGVGAGWALRPAPGAEADEASCGPPPEAEAHAAAPDAPSEVEYVKLNNQFVVPVMEGGDIRSLVILSLSIEAEAGQAQAIYAREPKLRDTFLRVLFDHANTGGFDGSFTESGMLEHLRRALKDAARDIIGAPAQDVLILDIIRQKA